MPPNTSTKAEGASVIIRPFRYGDDAKVQKILDQAAMSTAWPMFIAFAKREVTSQIILMLAAILFIVVGLQLMSSLLSIPIVLLSLALTILVGHRVKIALTHQDLNDVSKSYQSHPRSGFWVAEVVDSKALSSSTDHRATIAIDLQPSRPQNCSPEIIGTIAVTIKRDPDLREPPESVAWLRRMAVSPQYRRKGVGLALTDVALDHCAKANFRAVELLTTEFHQAARSLYASKGFELIGSTRKSFLGGLLGFSLYRLRVSCTLSRQNLNA